MTTTYVSSGVLSSGGTFSSGGIEVVLNGGSAKYATIGSGGEQIVSSGGFAAFTTVESGGTEIVISGTLHGATIESGGQVFISAGGSSFGDSIQSGATEVVLAGAHVTSSLVAGIEIVSGGHTQSSTVVSGGVQTVESGAVANRTHNLGTENISAGASATHTSNYGVQNVYSGGEARGTHDFGGEQYVLSGGVALRTTVSGLGVQTIESGGVASKTVINSGGTVVVSGGTVFKAVDQHGGRIVVYGGATENTILSGFESVVGVDGVATGYNSEIVSGGGLYTGANGIDDGATVKSGGLDAVDQGGQSIDVVVKNGGLQEVRGATSATGSAALGGIATSTTVMSGGTLLVYGADGITSPSADIIGTDLMSGGTIDLRTISYVNGATATLDPTTDVLSVTDGANVFDLQLSGDYTGQFFTFSADGSGGTDITLGGVPCYVRGTRVLTDQGEVAVEDLAIGDRLITASGAGRTLRWIGTRAYDGRFAAGNRDILPVTFKAGSLGDALPVRDLHVSPLHAMFIDGALIPAAALVNGVSIVQAEKIDRVEYFHLELDSHDVILAEGAPSESFVDDGSRFMFHNAAEFAALYPDTPRVAPVYCAPRAENGPVVEAVRARLAALLRPATAASCRGLLERARRGGIVGWAVDDANPGRRVTVRIRDNGVVIGETVADLPRADLATAGIGDGAHGFVFTVAGGLSPLADHCLTAETAEGVAIEGKIVIAAQEPLKRTA